MSNSRYALPGGVVKRFSVSSAAAARYLRTVLLRPAPLSIGVKRNVRDDPIALPIADPNAVSRHDTITAEDDFLHLRLLLGCGAAG